MSDGPPPRQQFKRLLVDVVAARATRLGLSLVTVAVLARLYGAADFGALALALLVVTAAEAAALNIIYAPLIQSARLDPDALEAATILALGIAVAAVIVTALASIMLEAELALSIYGWAALAGSAVLKTWSVIPTAVLRLRGDYKTINTAGTLGYLLTYSVPAVAFGLMGAGSDGLLVAYFAHAATTFLLLVRRARIPVGWTVKPAAISLYTKNMRSTSASAAMNWLANNSTNMLVGFTLGVSAVGHLTRANALGRIIKDITGNAIAEVLMPHVALNQLDTQKLRAEYLLILPTCLCAYGLCAAFVSAHAETLITVMLGKRWLEIEFVLVLLMVGFIAQTTNKINETIAAATGRFAAAAARQVVYALATILLVSIGCQFSLEAAALGGAVAAWLLFALASMDICRQFAIGPRPIALAFAKASAPALVYFAVVTAARGLTPAAAPILMDGIAATVASVATITLLLGPPALLPQGVVQMRRGLARKLAARRVSWR